jgi:hypothetical protein
MDFSRLSQDQIVQLYQIAQLLHPLPHIPGSQPIVPQQTVGQPIPQWSPITAYQSQSTPAAIPVHPFSQSATMQPLLGFNELGTSMTSQVNQQCLNIAAVHGVQQPRLPSRGRTRVSAVPPPGPRRGPRIPRLEDCSVAPPVGVGVATEMWVRTLVKVYPPPVRHKFC